MDTADQQHRRAQTYTSRADTELDIDIIDLPETSQDTGNHALWARAWIWRAVIAWQRSIPPGARRLMRGLATPLLTLVALIVILGSLYHSQAVPTPLSSPSPAHSAANAGQLDLDNVAYDQHPLMIYRGQHGPVLNVTWSPDGSRLAAGGVDGTVQIWDRRSGRLLLTYPGHHSLVLGLAWSPDGRRIASVSDDATAQAWDARSGKLLFLYRSQVPNRTLESVAWSPDGSRIVIGEGLDTVDGQAQVWNVQTGKLLRTYHMLGFRPLLHVAWSPDGSSIASSSGTIVEVWNAMTGGRILTYDGHTALVSGVAWSPDGAAIATSSLDTTVQVWNARSGKRLFTYFGHNDLVNGLAWSPDGTTIASGGADRTLQVWNAFLGQHIVTYLTQAQIYSVAWFPHGPLVATGGSDGLVTLWLVA